MPEELLRQTFVEQLNTRFSVQTEAENILELELIKVEEIISPPGQEQFSLLFRGRPDVSLSQGIYKVEHEKMGASDLFLVPIARDQDGFYLEACFNRLLP
jgi:hypothetical protein